MCSQNCPSSQVPRCECGRSKYQQGLAAVSKDEARAPYDSNGSVYTVKRLQCCATQLMLRRHGGARRRSVALAPNRRTWLNFVKRGYNRST